jgi:hypothetical protein
MSSFKPLEGRMDLEDDDQPHVSVKEVMDRYKADGIDLTVEQAQKIRIFLHTMAKIALNQILREK